MNKKPFVHNYKQKGIEVDFIDTKQNILNLISEYKNIAELDLNETETFEENEDNKDIEKITNNNCSKFN